MTRSSRALLAAVALLGFLALLLVIQAGAGAGSATPTVEVPEVEAKDDTTLSEVPRTPRVNGGDPQRTALNSESTAEPRLPLIDQDGQLLLRGRVVDSATAEGVANAQVLASDIEAPTDADGRFTYDMTVPEGITLRVMDQHNGTHIRDVRFEDLGTDTDGGLLLSIRIGPTTRFLLPQGTEGTAEDWMARLVFLDDAGNREEQGWVRPRGTGQELSNPAWIRYDNPILGDGEDREQLAIILLEARNNDGTLIAQARTSTGIGISPEVALLKVTNRLGSLRGLVVDLDGEPLNGVRVFVAPLFDPVTLGEAGASHGSAQNVGTDDDGSFVLLGLLEGLWQLHVVHENSGRSHSQQVQVYPEVAELDPVVLDVPTLTGEIHGSLKSDPDPLPYDLMMLVRDLEGPYRRVVNVNRRRFAVFGIQGSGLHELDFRIDDLPPGRYGLSIMDHTGARWSPAEAIASPPAEDIVFTRILDDSLGSLRVTAVSAVDGSLLDAFTLRMERLGRELHAQRISSASPLVELSFTGDLLFYVHASGYATRLLRPSEIRREEGELRATVELQPGWSGRLVFLDCLGQLDAGERQGVDLWLAREEHPGVAGVEILVDGKRVAVSGADGNAWVELNRPPTNISFRNPEHRVLGSLTIRNGRWQEHDRDGVVWLLAR